MTIDITEVKEQLKGFVEDTSACADVMRTINANYIEGTKNVWSSMAAAEYITNLCIAFNDYISQFNTNYQEGVNNFVAGVNALARNEDASPVPECTVEKLPELAKTWEGDLEKFNVPDDYAGFTETNLKDNIEKFKSHIDSMQAHIKAAVENGLNGSFCTGLRASLESLKNSADEVVSEYSRNAAKRAVEQDSAISTIKSNT